MRVSPKRITTTEPRLARRFFVKMNCWWFCLEDVLYSAKRSKVSYVVAAVAAFPVIVIAAVSPGVFVPGVAVVSAFPYGVVPCAAVVAAAPDVAGPDAGVRAATPCVALPDTAAVDNNVAPLT